MSPVKSQLEQLLEILRVEKDEDYRLYKQYMQSTSLKEKTEKGVCWHPLAIRETGYSVGDYPYLMLERMKSRDVPHQFSAGKAVQLYTTDPEEKEQGIVGVVHFVDHNKMKVIFHQNELPDWIDRGKLCLQVHFDDRSYDEMEQAVKHLIAHPNTRSFQLAEVLLGAKQAYFEGAIQVDIDPSLNESQQQAVSTVLRAKDVAILHGPPGTGKTTTLVEAIKHLAWREKQVLVCAPSNTAADLLTEKLAEKGLNVLRIGNLSRIDESLLEHTLEGKISSHPRHRDIKKLRNQADEYKRMANKYKRHFGFAEREQRRLLQKEARSLMTEAVDIEQYIVDNLLDQAQVITCTLVGSMNRYVAGKTFKTVVIDEAAQALEPACWIPILKAEKVVMAGDPFQLPPTVKSAEAQRRGLNKTLIEKCIDHLSEVSLLKVQYRMNKHIMAYSNNYFYNNALLAHPSVANGSIDSLAIEFIDTAGCGFEEVINPESKSYYNPEEYRILIKHLQQLVETNQPFDYSVGIIAPYKEQVIFMNGSIEHDMAYLAGLSINTIDSFQGQEKDIIYISMVRSNDRSEIGFLADYRRMNVAMTRARKKLVVIGDSATIGADAFFAGFISYCESNNFYRSAWEWMG